MAPRHALPLCLGLIDMAPKWTSDWGVRAQSNKTSHRREGKSREVQGRGTHRSKALQDRERQSNSERLENARSESIASHSVLAAEVMRGYLTRRR